VSCSPIYRFLSDKIATEEIICCTIIGGIMKNNNYKNSGKAIFKEAKCDKSHFCPVTKACPTNAVTRIKQGFMKIDIAYDAAKCIGCGNCIKSCPHAAFAMK
jgi:Fe-S-cluster-containing dehydrogenase component